MGRDAPTPKESGWIGATRGWIASDASQTNPNGSFFRSATHTANADVVR